MHVCVLQAWRAFLVAQTVKNPLAMWKTWVQSLGCEDPLEEGMATHSSILAWGIAMDREAWRATVHAILESQTWLCWAFFAMRGLSLVVVSGGYSSLWCSDFSLWWHLLL